MSAFLWFLAGWVSCCVVFNVYARIKLRGANERLARMIALNDRLQSIRDAMSQALEGNEIARFDQLQAEFDDVSEQFDTVAKQLR